MEGEVVHNVSSGIRVHGEAIYIYIYLVINWVIRWEREEITAAASARLRKMFRLTWKSIHHNCVGIYIVYTHTNTHTRLHPYLTTHKYVHHV